MRRRLDALLGRKFKTTKFIATVNLAVSRVPVLKNQHQARLAVARSDVIELLNLNHHEHALLRVDEVIKEQNMLDVFVMMEGYFHLLLQKVNLIEKQKDCPDELKEAVSSLLFAASRCGEFPELQEVRGILTSRYGKEFAYGAMELRSNCGVNLKMIQKLSLRQSSLETRMKILQDIAIENGVVLKLEDSSLVQSDAVLLDEEGGEESESVMDDEISEVLSFSESGKGKKKYRDVEDAAQAAFESAAYAAAAARAAVEHFRLRSFDTDNPDSSNLLPRKVLDSSNEQSKLQMKNEETQAGKTLENSDSDGGTPVEKMMACDVKWNVDEKIYFKDYDLSQLPDSPDCPSLVKLSLQVPDLTIIPPNFFELMPNLEVLDLSNTNIVSLPTSISSLKSLQKFFLKDCFALMELPTQIGMLSKLKLFDIKGTELMFIPKEMGKLQDLEVLRISLSQYAKDYIKIKSVNETVFPKNMISELKQLKELCINVPPEAEWWEEEVKHIQNELCDLENLETLRWFLPTNEVLQQFLLLERYHLPVYANLSNFMLTIGQHAQLTSCLPCDLEKKFEEFKNCLKWINAEGNMDGISKIMANVEALFLSHHWTIDKLSKVNVLNLKYCLLAECNEMETLVEAHGLSENVEIRKKNAEKVGLELLQYLSIHHMMKLQSIWKGPIGEDSLSKLRILALHSCPQLTLIFTLTIAQNLSCLAQLTVEDCPKVISLINGESQKVKYSPIFPSLEKIFILDLPELVNIFVGHIMLEKLTTILIYSCPQLQDLCDMELPHIEKIEGEIEWWKGLGYGKSQWENVFVPLKKRRDLVKQLSEATNSLKHFHDVLSQGNDEKKLSNLTDMREQVTTPDTRMEKGKELFLPPEETEDNESYGWSHSEALDMESQSDVFSAFTEVDRFSLSGQGFARSEDAIEGDVVENEEDRFRIKNWHKGDLLGRGSFGSVYEGINDSGLFFAVKEVSCLDQGSQGKQCILQLEQEISLLSQFQHDNIVRYLGTDKDDGKLYIFLELVSKGSLANLYRKYHLRDHQVSSFTRQILSGLSYLHDRNVVHRNIKCSNILVDANGSVKLADFGLAEVTKPNDIKSCKGTAFWMAPEVVNTKNGDGRAADIWSLGCTVLEMLTGQVPYFPLEMMAALFRIGNGIPPPIPNTLSSEARDFIFQCLQVNPNDRPTAAQLLNHQFVQTPVSKGGKSNPRR